MSTGVRKTHSVRTEKDTIYNLHQYIFEYLKLKGVNVKDDQTPMLSNVRHFSFRLTDDGIFFFAVFSFVLIVHYGKI